MTTPSPLLAALLALPCSVIGGLVAATLVGSRRRHGCCHGPHPAPAADDIPAESPAANAPGPSAAPVAPAPVAKAAPEPDLNGLDEEHSATSYAAIAEALAGGYECIYYVDAETGRYAEYRSHGLYEKLDIESTGEDFFGSTLRNIPRDLHPDDAKRVAAAFDRQALLGAVANGHAFSITYRLLFDGQPVWYTATVTRTQGGHGRYVVVGVSNVEEQMRREQAHEEELARTIAKLETMLAQSARSRTTLVKLATYQDADELRDLAMRETAQMLGAVGVYLFRHHLDGTTPLVQSWFRSPEFDVLPKDAAQTLGVLDYLDDHDDIRYVLDQKEANQPAWDDMLRRMRSQRFLAGLIRVDGEVWGHVGYLCDRPGIPDRAELELFHEACALVQIAVLRAKILETRDTHQRHLVASARAASQAARAKTMFLATMSHEIRTPLNAVIGYSEFLNRPGLKPEEIAEYTSGITHSANALLSLINDILDLSKLEAGKVDMTGRCDLGKLFDELLSLFHYRAKTKDLRLSFNIAKDFPRLALSEEHMRQILLNLVGNAVKFTDDGTVEWSADAHRDGENTVSVNIVVSDSGIGIAKEKLATIFDPFTQDGSTRGGKVYSGTGLGLPIVKRLLEACGGDVRIESEPGKGTKVRLHIARVPVLPPEERHVEQTPARPLALPDGFRALLVDDVPINLKILDLHVSGFGIRNIDKAESAAAAMDAIAQHRPDIVLTDMWMPGMSGADLAAEIRKDHSLDSIPIVAVTADNDVGATFDPSLFAEIVTKPVTAAKLRHVFLRLFPDKEIGRHA